MDDVKKTRVSDEEMITFLDYTYSLVDSSPRGREAIRLYMAVVKLARSAEYNKRVFRNDDGEHFLFDMTEDILEDDTGGCGEVICD